MLNLSQNEAKILPFFVVLFFFQHMLLAYVLGTGLAAQLSLVETKNKDVELWGE